MAEKLESSITLGRRIKWIGVRLVQLVGFAMIALGAYPFFRPFLAAVVEPPAVVDTFVQSFGISLVVMPDFATSNLRGIVFIAIGAVVVWVSTSKRTFT